MEDICNIITNRGMILEIHNRIPMKCSELLHNPIEEYVHKTKWKKNITGAQTSMVHKHMGDV